METWVNLKGDWGNLYQVSNTGSIRSMDFIDSLGRFRKGRILKYQLDKRGYIRLSLCYKYKKWHPRIHRLVAIAFIPNPLNLPQVNHLDGNKENNNDWNLEWTDNSGNQIHAIKTGLRTFKTGKDSHLYKSSVKVYDKDGDKIDELYGNIDMKEKGYDFRNISAVVNGKRSTYKGLIFKR